MAAPAVLDPSTSSVVSAARVAHRLLVAAGARPAVAAALRTVAGTSDTGGRRPALMPAAVRVERSRARGRRGELSEQTALTLWFGEGPSLPTPGGAGRVRVVAGTALAVVGAAVLGAATYLVNQREAARIAAPREVIEPQPRERIDSGG